MTYLRNLDPGGVERVALRLHAAWRSAGAESLLVLASDRGAQRHEALLSGYRVIAPTRTASWKSRWPMLRLCLALPHEIDAFTPDVLFCAGNSYSLVAVVTRWRLGRRCPVVVAKISNDLGRRDMPSPVRVLYRIWLLVQGRTIDHFIGMATPTLAEIAHTMKVASGRISVIEDPALTVADLDRLQLVRTRNRTHQGRRFVGIGRLVRQKNFNLLLHCFAGMAGPADRLTILGEGSERGRLLALAATLGIGRQVTMPGHVHPIDDWIVDADTFVMSSDYEGVPAALIEALAAGLWVIATDCSVGMAGLLDHGRLGTLVAVGDADALTAAMAACPHRVDRATAGAMAQRFTVERAGQAYLAVMAAAARRGRGRVPDDDQLPVA